MKTESEKIFERKSFAFFHRNPEASANRKPSEPGLGSHPHPVPALQ